MPRKTPVHRRMAWMDMTIGLLLGLGIAFIVLNIIGEVWI